jgi:nucleoside-diphosphate-sugar epimerase
MEKVLITGGSGFIGRYFVDRLKHAEVVLFDIRLPDYPSHASHVLGDVRDLKAFSDAANGCTMIIHLAAMHHDFGIDESAYFDTNVGGAKNLIEVAQAHNIRKVINFSSVAVYGHKGNPGPTDENTEPAPTNAYGKSKLEAEAILRNWALLDAQNRLVQVRSTVVFGAHNLANVLNLIKAIDQGLYFHISERNNIKSLAYVENIADATLFGLDKTSTGELLFNYVDYPQMSSKEIANMQAEFLRKKILLKLPLWVAVGLALPFDLAIKITGKNLKISSARVKKLCTQTYHKADKIRDLGFKPRHEMRDGMERMIRWYLINMKKN